ncbi:MAG: ribosome biogenesis GTP-binding protein YihA/YsxC [Lachnospiraceae bacterium]
MIIRDVNLETVCGITSTLPEHDKIELAFAGKSNVGKSSLINALMNRKALARTSAQPGKTQTINFYHIACYQLLEDEKVANELYFVDLPGYGYARANEEIKAKWGKMIENYLHKSEMLRVVFLLIDIRHEPSGNDKMMYDWILNNGYEPVIIATKADKISRGQLQKHIKMIKEGLRVVKGTTVLPFSALSKNGRDEIYAFIDDIVLHQQAE